MTAVLHVHSNISSGTESPETIARRAAGLKIDAVFMTDLLHERYEYGIAPFRHILKKSVERPSILRYGTARYLEDLNRAGEAHGVFLIDGAAVTPHYYWTGNPWRGSLVLHDRAKDLLVLGAGAAASYENLPLPGRGSTASPYRGPAGEKPYQAVMDAAKKAGGLVFWSHPLAEERRKFNNIFLGFDLPLATAAYPMAMRDTTRYTGIGIYSVELAQIHVTSEKASAAVSGIWDQILMDYCRGRRDAPVWVAGEVDYNGVPGQNNDLAAVLNILTTSGRSREEALGALEKGRFYVVLPEKGRRLALTRFTIADADSGEEASQGQTLELTGAPLLRLAADFTDASPGRARLTILRNDRMIHDETEALPLAVEFPDSGDSLGPLNYYRIILQSETGSTLVSNPVFVQKTKKGAS